MSFLTFILGIICGFCAKLGFDYYHKFILRQEKASMAMEEILINWKAIEKAKNIDL